MTKIALLLLIVVAVGAKTVEKRSLVSRFTSNPFFLSHFSDNPYSRSRPWIHETYGQPRIYSYYQNEDNASEESEENEEIALVANNIVKETYQKIDRVIPVTEQQEEINEESEASEEDPGIIFNILPHFDRKSVFRKEEEKQEKENVKKSEDNGFHFKWPISSKSEETTKTDRNNTEVVIYLFKSLPLFDRKNDFKQTSFPKIEEKAKKSEDKIGLAYAFTSLPHFERSYVFLQPQPSTLIIESEERKPSRRRKVLKLVRRRKLSDVTDFSETQRKIESVADLPLENSVKTSNINSYGGLLSPIS